MHEYSIVQALLDQCENHALENHAKKVTKVVIKIGKYSGVEPHLFEIAFDTFKEATICDGCELVINIQPLVIMCGACGTQSNLDQPHYCCPICGSTDLIVKDGEDMYLMSLEIEE